MKPSEVTHRLGLIEAQVVAVAAIVGVVIQSLPAGKRRLVMQRVERELEGLERTLLNDSDATSEGALDGVQNLRAMFKMAAG